MLQLGSDLALSGSANALLYHDEPAYALAVSGGGDSMALLALVLGLKTGKPVHALIVDHGLRAGSKAEAQITAERAAAMGAQPQILTWQPDSPVTSAIQERARIARYGLMGQACRTLGLTRLYLGHNRDDQAETIYMRGLKRESGAIGGAGMTDVTYAPVWPQLRGVSLARPLLDVSRGDLREFAVARGVSWLEDPSNESDKFERVRVRAALQAAPNLLAEQCSIAKALGQSAQQRNGGIDALIRSAVTPVYGGGFLIRRGALDSPLAAHALQRILLCASGQAQAASLERVRNLQNELRSGASASRTLGGALISARGDDWLISRDSGAVLGRADKAALSAPLHSGQPLMWDGRFEISARYEGPALYVQGFGERYDHLSEAMIAKVKGFALPVRKALPVITRGGKIIAMPHIDHIGPLNDFECKDCTVQRLHKT